MAIEKNKEVENTSVKNTSVGNTSVKNDDKRKPSLKYQRDKDREKVKGIFKFYECPGSQLSFSYRKYKEDDVETFTFIDGQIYTIPLGVAKHLNSSGQYPVHKYLKDDEGRVAMRVGQKVRRYGFQSLEFIDIDEFENSPSEIVTVEKI